MHLAILIDGEIMFSADVENVCIRHGTPMPDITGRAKMAAATAVTTNYLLPDDERDMIRKGDPRSGTGGAR